MYRMKVLVVGLGSMGKRRIRLLKRIKSNLVIIGVDNNKERAECVRKEYKIEVCTSIESAIEKYRTECAIISTAPTSHAVIIQTCLENGMHVFTELNLISDKYIENMKLAVEKQKILFLSSTFLYRDEVQFMMKKVKNHSGLLNYSYHIGQYLPDWHPWESFQNFFVGKKETNGCREIFAIELPWLMKAFGEIDKINVLAGNNTTLNVDYPDNYLVLIQHKTGHKGMVAVDVMSRKAVRNFELFGEQLYMSWDGSPTGLKEYDLEKHKDKKIALYDNVDTIEGYSSFVIENAYENELRNFFDVINGESEPQYSFEEDLVTLKWIDRIEGKCVN